MDHPHKRLKNSSGAPVKTNGASSLRAYQPPTASPPSTRPSATVARQGNGKTSLRLTVKAPPSKLRQATSGSSLRNAIPPNPYTDDASDSDATPQPAPRAARATRNPRTLVEPDSDEEDEDEAEVQDEDEEMEDADNDNDEADDDSEEDAEEADEDEDEEEEVDEEDDIDELQSDHPPPPIIKRTQPPPSKPSKPNVTITAPPPEAPLKSVEDKEMEMEDDDDDDEELSELESGDEQTGLGDDDELDEEEEEDSDTPDSDEDNSRSATPDLSKLTRRQRGIYEEADASSLMALSNEAQKKKHLTAEEHAMRRAEMARRRKNLSEKRNEEEKMDTINKLLKKPATKRRTRAEMMAEAAYGTPNEDGEYDEPPPDPLYVRWVNNVGGSRLGVPGEWLEAPVGDVFQGGSLSGGGSGRGHGRMVEEVGG